MVVLGQVIDTVLWICILFLIARFVLEWVRLLARSWRPSGLVLVLCEGIYTVTDPPLRMVRRLIPPIRMGSAALDLSPIVLLIGIYILQAVNAAVLL